MPTQYRLAPSQRRFLLALTPLYVLPVILSLTIGHGMGVAVVWGAVLCSFWIVFYRAIRRFGVELEDDDILLMGFRHQRIAWDQVDAIKVQRRMGTQGVVLITAGRRRRLRAPMTGPLQTDRAFDDKVEAIRWWWATHRSPEAPLVADLMVGDIPPRSTGHVLELVATGIVGAYAAVWFLIAILVEPHIAGRLLVADLLALLVICALRPVRPVLRRQWQAVRHPAR